MKNILISGAAGFIGSAVANHYLKNGKTVVTIDNLSTGRIDNIPEGTVFIQGNCQDQEIISKLNNYQFDAVFHIAGQSSGEISFDNPVYDLQTNTQSTLLLLKYCLSTNCKKFIYASTMSVYGDQPDFPVAETAKTEPKSFYGVGKLASENYLRIYSHYGLDTTALRLFNVYGPGQNMENLRQGMVSIFLAQAITDKEILVKGSKDRYRDFVYIDDVVNAFNMIGEHGYNNGKYSCYNVCSGIKTKVEELINTMSKNLPFDVKTEYSGSTPGDQFGITGDNNRIKSSLGWSAETSLNDGLKNMINWAINNMRK